MASAPRKKISRRKFIGAGVAGLAGMALTSKHAELLAKPTTPLLRGVPGASTRDDEAISLASVTRPTMRYRTLGRTGLKVSEMGFGAYAVTNPEVVAYALDKGINYFDTSHCYQAGGNSEVTLGKGLKGKRDKVVLTTKWCPYHADKPDKKEFFLAQLDESLTRLGTDHVDVLLTHQVGKNSDGLGVARLQNPELFEAWETAHKAGKARFFGCSGHDGDLMDVMNYAVDCGKFDVMLCRYNFLDYPTQQDLIRKAKAQGVGFIAMKTLSGAKGADLSSFQSKMTTFKQAALKWVLSNPDVSNLIITISSFAQVDEYVPASGSEFALADRVVLNEYAGLFSNEVCRFCNRCEPACPHNVRVADILRYSMYYHEYKEEGRGIRSYAKLEPGHNASKCPSCPAPCVKECPYDLPIKTLLLKAHNSLA